MILLGIAFGPNLLLGFAINAVLLWVAIASVWSLEDPKPSPRCAAPRRAA